VFRSIQITFIVIMTLLLCLPGFASENTLRVFDNDHFTINLSAHMRQVEKNEMPPIDDKDSLTYVFVESDKKRKKSILLMISLEKINNHVPNILKGMTLKEMAKTLRDRTASHTDCRGRTTELAKTQLSGKKSYYFERRSESCVVTLERYWTTIKGDHSFFIYLARPVNGDDETFRKVMQEIRKIKLK
jgi:hypothetical protein